MNTDTQNRLPVEQDYPIKNNNNLGNNTPLKPNYNTSSTVYKVIAVAAIIIAEAIFISMYGISKASILPLAIIGGGTLIVAFKIVDFLTSDSKEKVKQSIDPSKENPIKKNKERINELKQEMRNEIQSGILDSITEKNIKSVNKAVILNRIDDGSQGWTTSYYFENIDGEKSFTEQFKERISSQKICSKKLYLSCRVLILDDKNNFWDTSAIRTRSTTSWNQLSSQSIFRIPTEKTKEYIQKRCVEMELDISEEIHHFLFHKPE